MRKPEKTVAVIGAAGIVGLGTTAAAIQRGYTVIPYDINTDANEHLNRGVLPDGNNNKAVGKLLPFDGVVFTDEQEALRGADIYIICVPTDVDDHTREFKVEKLQSAIEMLAPYYHSKDVVIIESTIHHETVDTLGNLLREMTGRNTVHLAHCPEFVNPGNEEEWDVSNISRPLGALTEHAKNVALEFYSHLLGENATIRPVASAGAAADGKIDTNAFRSVNIARVNELVCMYEKIPNGNIWAMLEAAGIKPYGYLPFTPGPGVGGHCVGVDEKAIASLARNIGQPLELLEKAIEVNERMPLYVAETIHNIISGTFTTSNGHGPKVTFLGIAYKQDMADDRESPTPKVMRHLGGDNDYRIEAFDPNIPSKSSLHSLEEALSNADLAVLITAHKEFRDLCARDFERMGVRVVYDTRNIYDHDDFSESEVKLVTLGVHHPYSPTLKHGDLRQDAVWLH